MVVSAVVVVSLVVGSFFGCGCYDGNLVVVAGFGFT